MRRTVLVLVPWLLASVSCANTKDPGEIVPTTRDASIDAVDASCGDGTSLCDDTCVDVTSDPANCGKCDNACPIGQVCTAGKCAVSCGSLTVCPTEAGPGTCANLKTDPLHCGDCNKPCPDGQLCNNGVCDVVCSDTLEKCGSKCVDPKTDPEHCGGCDKPCTFAKATPTCADGACKIGACEMGFGNCDGDATNGCEANLGTSLSHCGKCDAKCTMNNAVGGCTAGKCAISSCNPNYEDCDTDPSNGCEANIATSTAHCGKCGRACGAMETCKAGVCTTTVVGTYTATVKYSGSPPCAVCGTNEYLCLPMGSTSRAFTDPLPAGAKLATGITVKLYGLGCGGAPVTVRVNSATIGSFTPGGDCSCGTCDPPYSVTLSNPSGIAGYVVGGSNTLTLVPSSATTPCIQRAEISVSAG